MENAEKVFAGIEDELVARDGAREKAIHTSRGVIRLTKSLIKEAHAGEDIGGRLPELAGAVRELTGAVEEHPSLANSGVVEAALAEAAEVSIFWCGVKGMELPDPQALGVTPTAYLMGAADAVGEMRRYLMSALLRDDLEEAQRVLGEMEVLYDQLNRYNLPDGIVPLRRKQDAVRGILDRTRSLIVEAVEKRR